RRPVADRAVHDVAVAAAANPEVARPVKGTLTRVDDAGLVPEAGDVLERRRDRGLEAHVDLLTTAGRLACQERAHDADRREDAGLVVGLEAERAERRSIAMAVHVEHATEGLRDGVRRAPGPVGAQPPEGREPR